MKHNLQNKRTVMKLPIIVFASLISTSALGMQKQIPPAKEGAAALLNFVFKKCGLTEIDTEETQKILSAFAELTNDRGNTIHELMLLPAFQTLANRTAEKDYLIDLELLTAMKDNNAAKIRSLLEKCQNRQSIKDTAKKFLDEEIQANQQIVDPKGK